ncbi:ACP S-malonyltransferase [Dorea sp. AM58-8]|uniref:ACP S-malonyltransferase n=1 Tax=Dorea sp. AM58-8 TaxID=2292346 RepID=UPI000E4A77DE|nr:ACP S-malonyltransferase [Dorea sp. AM58-8]RGY82327.1 [acyl-carrier-protein] S-malonyltransferase [Dorea sp. AM58-8]
MSKIAFIYPGQGAQKAGMGKDFYENSPLARDVYDRASECLKLDMRALCFEENDLLDQTEYTQAAMVTTCLAMTAVLNEQGAEADVTAGLSLGEYCAIAEAGAMDLLDAIRLVRVRGQLMQHTVPTGEGAMAAVLGMDADQIDAVIEPIANVTVANYNCPGQIVITGGTAGIEQASKALKEAGAKRVVPLNVSGPFHSPMLRSAGEKLGKELLTVQLGELKIPYVTNVTAEYVTDSSKIRELLTRQVYSPVRWEQSIRKMIAQGVDTFVEIGPGRTLTGFLRKIDRNVTVYQVNTWEDSKQIMEELWKKK